MFSVQKKKNYYDISIVKLTVDYENQREIAIEKYFSGVAMTEIHFLEKLRWKFEKIYRSLSPDAPEKNSSVYAVLDFLHRDLPSSENKNSFW